MRLFTAVLAWALLLPAVAAADSNTVQLIPVKGVPEYRDAAAPGAISRACASDVGTLASLFADYHLRFEHKLVRQDEKYGYCHVYYKPTLPGFRATPESSAVTGLFGGVDTQSFVARRKPMGDSLDIVKTVLSRLTRPVNVTLTVPVDFDPRYWTEATRFHFPVLPHPVSFRPSTAASELPWVQDYLKPGEAGGEMRILVTRRLYEGTEKIANLAGPLLDGFEGDLFVRSKLSWEGGDIQIAADPKKPGATILFYGACARDYWGLNLTLDEYQYILRTEFGADQAVDLTPYGPHADFLVSFLPEEKTVLLAEPVQNDMRLARAAADELHRIYGDRAPRELHQLSRHIAHNLDGQAWDPESIPRLTKALRARLREIPAKGDREVYAAIEEYVARNCPDNGNACFTTAGQRRMLREDPDLLRRSLDVAAELYFQGSMPPRLLGIIESQLPGGAEWQLRQLEATAARLRQLGFSVLRMPYLYVPSMANEWAGVSYVNLLLVDHKLFVPAFGLGEAEAAYIAEMQRKVGPRYEVVPVYARYALTNNAGVHCAFGIIRNGMPRPVLTD